MFEVSEIIYAILNADAPLDALVGSKIFPLVADQNTKPPFITYSIQELPSYSKAKQFQYTIEINGYDETYKSLTNLSDIIKQAMINAPDDLFYYLGANSEYIDEKILIIKHEYKFKK